MAGHQSNGGNGLPKRTAEDENNVTFFEFSSKRRSVVNGGDVSNGQPQLASRNDSGASNPINGGNDAVPGDDLLASSSSQLIDIDADNDPLLCSIYGEEIIRQFRILELRKWSATLYAGPEERNLFDRQLIAWVVVLFVHNNFSSETLHLAVGYFDGVRYETEIEQKWLLLLAVACSFIASKYEEVKFGNPQDFCNLAASSLSFSLDELLSMEGKVLDTLSFDLNIPTTTKFLRRFICAAQAENQDQPLDSKGQPFDMSSFCNYLAELTLLRINSLRFLPSLVAASIVFLARLTINDKAHPWNSTLQHYTGYKPSDLKRCVYVINHLRLKPDPILKQAIERYDKPEFNCVGRLLPPYSIPDEFFEDIFPQPPSSLNQFFDDI